MRRVYNSRMYVVFQDMVLFKMKQDVTNTGEKLDPKKFLLVVDDCNLPIGKAVIRLRGGYGGSYFLEQMAQVIDIEEMPRLRVGVGGNARIISSIRKHRSYQPSCVRPVPAVKSMSQALIDEWLREDFDRLGRAVLPRLQNRYAHWRT